MKFWFAEKKLQNLYEFGKGAEKFPPGVVNAFFELVATIRASADERVLRSNKGARLEKLRRPGRDHSLRLNSQFRLIIEFSEHDGETWVDIKAIEDYH